MASLAKKILSAFIEVDDDDNEKTSSAKTDNFAAINPMASEYVKTTQFTPGDNEKFKQYFEKLFNDANLPGPDYFEFSKMIEAMMALPDEKTRYVTAYAGLSVQGLDIQKLLGSASEYIKILDTDAAQFHGTLDNAIKQKVDAKKADMETKSKRIQELTREITNLNNTIALLGNEIKENEEKIRESGSGYTSELEKMKSRIQSDISRIRQYIGKQ
ncbi:MAG: hypothetical protein ABIX01_04755 [Chitinophagaceae bacterium]